MIRGREHNPDSILADFRRYIRAENSRRRGGFGFNFDTDEGKRFADQVRTLGNLEECFESGTAHQLDREPIGPAASKGDTAGFRPDASQEEQLSLRMPVPLDREVHFPEDLSDEQLLYYYSRRAYYADNIICADEEYYGRLYLLELANGLHHQQDEEALHAVFMFWDSMNAVQAQAESGRGNVMPAQIESGLENSNIEKQEAREEYLRRLCLSFLVAHPELADRIRQGLVDRDLYWKYDLIGEIRQGRFTRAGLFVKKYARLLKKEEISGDKPYVAACWEAMPYVFKSIDACFGENAGHLFRTFLTAGQETSTEVELLPVRRRAFGQKRRIALADTCYLDSHTSYGKVHMETWVRTEWTLREGAQDFLYVIHLYTESFVREYYHAPKRKRTADRFLKKKYLRTGDDPSVIRAMKEILKDQRFEKAIGEGVAVYMEEHPVPEQAKPVNKKQQAQILYQMDHARPERGSAVDYERFRQARDDAESVLHMLHHEEIDYEGHDQSETSDSDNNMNYEPAEGPEQRREDGHAQVPDKKIEDRNAQVPGQKREDRYAQVPGQKREDGHAQVAGQKREDRHTQIPEKITDNKDISVSGTETGIIKLNIQERQYLSFLMNGQNKAASDYLIGQDLSESLVMKNINAAALEVWDDVLLERADGRIVLVEDYVSDLKKMMGTA